MRNIPKKHYNIENDDLEKEDEKYQQEIKEANEERKDETEVLKKIEMIVGGRYRIVCNREKNMICRDLNQMLKNWNC